MTASDGFDRGSPRSIAREHVLGATVWAYGAGGARVVTWSRESDLPRLSSRVKA
jgi:hypothetical protein